MASFERPEVVPIRTQKVPQTIETPVTFVPVPGAYVRFAYSRSSDSMANQIEGQDYLCFRYNDQRMAFIVADGVGSSFCGNLASRILGDNLLDWLWSLDIAYLGGPAALTEAATSFLNRLQKPAQLEVEEHELPDTMSPLIKQALEAQRAYGSEAIFAACRIDHPSPLMPEGLVSLFWMGDTRIFALDMEGKPIDIDGTWENANRWSSTKGVRGKMHAWMHSLQNISRTIAFSDGLSAHEQGILSYPDSKLDREIHLGARLPTSDDVAIVDVILRTAHYEGYPDPALPDPSMERPHLEQIWNPTGEETYELRWNWPGKGNRVSYIIQEATSPALTDARTINVPQGETSWKPPEPQTPGHYYYRVRAVKRFGGLTPWSELRQTKVAHPAPPAPTLHPVEPDRAAVLHWENDGASLEYVLEQSPTPAFEDTTVVYEGRSTAWAIPTDKPGTYFYRVKAISDGGPGPWSETQEVHIELPPPATPSLANISYGYAHGEYELRWQPVPRATYYELEQRKRDEDERQIIETEDATHLIEGQAVGEYIYRVRACHESAKSEWSNRQVAVVTPVAPDTAPELTLEGPDEDGHLTLRWMEVPAAEEYQIEAADEPGFNSARVFTETGLELALTRREPGGYHFRVCGSNAGGDGPWSNVEEFIIVPEACGWIEATPSGDQQQVLVTWGAVGGRIAYRLEMSSSTVDDTAFHEVYQGPETQYTLDMPAGAGSLRFRVRAESGHAGAAATSGWTTSHAVSAMSPGGVPILEQPEVTESGEIKLSWSAVEDASGYLLEASTEEDFKKPRQVSFKETRALFRPPAAGQYWFRVRAQFDDGARSGEPGDMAWVQVRRPAAPSLWPMDPVKADEPYEITWTGIPGCVYYELQTAPTASFDPAETVTHRIFHPEQKYKLPGQPKGQRCYRVKAVDENEQASLWSKVLLVEAQ